MRLLLIAALICPAMFGGQMDDLWRDSYLKAQHAAASLTATPAELSIADDLFQKALDVAEHFGKEDIRVAQTLLAEGQTLRRLKKFTEAGVALNRAEDIFDLLNQKDANNLDSASVRFETALLRIDQGRYEEARGLIVRLLPAYDEKLGPNDPHMASALCAEGDALRLEKKYTAAEDSLRRCAEIRESDGGPASNALLGAALTSLGIVHYNIGQYKRAEGEFTLAEKIRVDTGGVMNPDLAETLEAHAALLKDQGKNSLAERKLKMAAAIRRSTKSAAPRAATGRTK